MSSPDSNYVLRCVYGNTDLATEATKRTCAEKKSQYCSVAFCTLRETHEQLYMYAYPTCVWTRAYTPEQLHAYMCVDASLYL